MLSKNDNPKSDCCGSFLKKLAITEKKKIKTDEETALFSIWTGKNLSVRNTIYPNEELQKNRY